MVSTMFRTMQERNPGIPGYSGGFYGDGEEGGRRAGTIAPTSGGTSGMLPEGEDGFATESKIESAAAACVLLSTVAVGCLIGGRPKSSVSQLLDTFALVFVVCSRASWSEILSLALPRGRGLRNGTFLSGIEVGPLVVDNCSLTPDCAFVPLTSASGRVTLRIVPKSRLLLSML